MRSLRVVLLASALILGPLVGATACGSTPSLAATDGMRSPVAVEDAFQISVPALWADDAAGTSGIEPARIRATRDGSALFTIDLGDIRAQGAGAQWTAASAAAAAVGAMVSGLNPGRVDVDFGVTGPIDGPSAGGILTVGVLAALLDTPIRGDMTMTGTISPDGSIGPVGGIALKLQAAADQGYRTVLLPSQNMQLRNPETSEYESAEQVGERLGLQVLPVLNVQEAFTRFTEGRFAYPAAPAFVLPATVQDVSAGQMVDLLAQVEVEAGRMPTGPQQALVDDLLARARTAERSGQEATAYGVGMLALNIANREQASAAAQAMLASVGVAGATGWLTDWVRRSTARHAAAWAKGLDVGEDLGYEQQVALPNALSWLAYDDAILQSVQQIIDVGDMDAARVDRLARILADVDTSVTVYFPNQLAIVQASPAQPSPGSAAVASYLAEYTEFLVRAGQAQQDYVQQVLLRGQDPAELARTNDVGLLLPVAGNLQSTGEAIASDGSLRDEFRRATVAVTYYVATSSLIAAVQGFGVDQFGIGSDPGSAENPQVMAASVSIAKAAVDQVAALLAQRGLDASLPVWAAAYGAGAAEDLSGTDQAAASQAIALNELYFDAVTVFMLQSGPVQ